MMVRVNVSIPDELLRQAKEAGLNISRLTRHAIIEELDRRAKIAALDNYLSELEEELGPVSAEDRAAAEAWADEIFGPADGSRRSA